MRLTCCHRSNDATAEMEALAKATANPDEINIASDDDDDDDGIQPDGNNSTFIPFILVPVEIQLEKQTVPSAVFGSIEEHGGMMGARQRLAAKKKQ